MIYSHESNDVEKIFQIYLSLFPRAAASSLRARAKRAKLLIVGFGDTVTHGCPMLSQKDETGAVFPTTLTGERVGEYLHILAQAPLGVEKTDRNRCTGLYGLYRLHPADVELRL